VRPQVQVYVNLPVFARASDRIRLAGTRLRDRAGTPAAPERSVMGGYKLGTVVSEQAQVIWGHKVERQAENLSSHPGIGALGRP
jgi:hypothetical protein